MTYRASRLRARRRGCCPAGAQVHPAQGNALVVTQKWPVGDHEGRLRPFPPQAVLGPAFTPGWRDTECGLLNYELSQARLRASFRP